MTGGGLLRGRSATGDRLQARALVRKPCQEESFLAKPLQKKLLQVIVHLVKLDLLTIQEVFNYVVMVLQEHIIMAHGLKPVEVVIHHHLHHL